MQIGVPREIKDGEHRVALTPAGVRELVDGGHRVIVEAGAGVGSGFEDEHFADQGAVLTGDAAAVYRDAELIVKVKEPQPDEVRWLQPRHTLFGYLHLAADEELTRALQRSGATCIAYEGVTDRNGGLPLLAPMSEVAGRLAAQAAAFALERGHGGRGSLLGGVAGVPPAKVMVIGAGVVGRNAAAVALGMGAETYVYDKSLERLRELEVALGGRFATCFAAQLEIEKRLPEVDVVIGAVLVRGAKAPHVLTHDHLRLLRAGSVLVDVSIDQGGCFETSRPTTHADPTYEVDGIIHYCVANIPGAVPATSTLALTNATLPYIMELAEHGVATALREDAATRAGLSIAGGVIVDQHSSA